jgi:hypothetical protein
MTKLNSVTLALGLVCFSTPASPQNAADLQSPPVVTSVPVRSHGTGGGCTFSGPFLRVPSKTAGPEGIVVRVSPPSKPRYSDGAPVAVHMISAIPRADGSIGCMSEQGFVDVGFLCTGAQYKAADGTIFKSGGSAFPPDPFRCIQPLADVISFAAGETRSLDGRSIQDYAGGISILKSNVGVIGWSFGGNFAVLAMAQFGSRFPGLSWYASWESPFLGTNEDRGSVMESNPFYDAKTGDLPFDRLRYSAEMPIWVFPPLPQPPGAGWPHGGLYLDGDDNGVFNKDRDYAFFAAIGGPLKFYYSLWVTREAAQRKVFGAEWPKHIATVDEAEAREAREDPLRQIPTVVKTLPNLSVLVFESHENHVIDADDHPHAVAQVNAWIEAGAHWVRFNPDSHYVEAMMGKKPSKVIQNQAGKKLDRSTIQEQLEPENADGGPTDKQGMTAGVCKLADRTYRKEWKPMLDHVLVSKK